MSGILQSKAHNLFSPNKLTFGFNTAGNVADEVKKLGANKALIVTDPGVVKADLLAPFTASLDAAGIPYAVYDRVKAEPPSTNVDEGAAMCKKEGCNAVIGIGGGSSLDVAKGVSVMAVGDGSILDVCGMDLVPKRGLPKILCPTTAGTGSEITKVLVITDEKENTKKAVYSDFVLADVALVDPMLTVSMPPHITADTGMDALVHAIETYVSVNATPFSDMLAEKTIAMIAQYLPKAWAKGSNLDGRYHMSLAATVTGIAFASGGLGAVHGLSYPLGTEYHMPHGRSNAIILPHVMRYNIPGNAEKFADIAELMGKDTEGLSDMEAAELAVEAVEELLTTLQIPYHLRDYDIPEGDIPKLAEGGMKQTRLFVPNPRDLTLEDIRSIYEDAF